MRSTTMLRPTVYVPAGTSFDMIVRIVAEFEKQRDAHESRACPDRRIAA